MIPAEIYASVWVVTASEKIHMYLLTSPYALKPVQYIGVNPSFYFHPCLSGEAVGLNVINAVDVPIGKLRTSEFGSFVKSCAESRHKANDCNLPSLWHI